MDWADESRADEQLASGLRQAWQGSGLTQREVLRRVGWFTDPAYLSRALSGQQTLSLRALQAVTNVLGIDYRDLLAEVGLDEGAYRSRFRPPVKADSADRSAPESVRDILVDELQAARKLKHEGKPEQVRGAIASVERTMRHLGGMPSDRETMLSWAALLCERVGLVQDVQLPHTVLRTARRDLRAVEFIAIESGAEDLLAAGRFYAGDAHYKDMDYAGAIPHYEWSAAHAPTIPLQARSLAGWAISLAQLKRPADRTPFHRLRYQIDELLASGKDVVLPLYIWDSEGWLLAQLWAEATLARSLVILGEQRKAEQALEAVQRRYEQATTEGFASSPFAMSIAQLRFLAACEGVFDMSAQDIIELGFHAYRLAEAGYSPRPQREIESLMKANFGLKIGAELTV